MSKSTVEGGEMQMSRSDMFGEEEQNDIKKEHSKSRQQKRAMSQYNMHINMCKNNPFSKFLTKNEFNEQDFKELDKLIINKMILPCVYRHKLWPELAKHEQHNNCNDFFMFINTPGFLKYFKEHQIIGLKTNEFFDKVIQQGVEKEYLVENSNAVAVILGNDLLIQDINRTFTQVQLFQENKPKFVDLCEVICCFLMKYNKYIQGVSLCCGLCLFYSNSKENGFCLVEKLVSSNIYQAFLDMNVELIRTYCDIIFKMVRSLMFSKPIAKQLFNKEISISEKDFNETIYETMSGSLAGIIISGFGKAGLEFGSQCIDYLCFCPQKQINKRYIILCVSYYLMIFSQIQVVDELICAITKQITRTQAEIAKFKSLVHCICNNPQWLSALFSSLDEILNYI